MTKEMWSAVWSMIGTIAGLGMLAGLFAVIPPPGHAQDANDRTRAALPALVEQRNNAMDAAALCQGDVAILKAQLAEAKAEIEKLKSFDKGSGPPPK